ncbi:UNVERIFIED_CONTAM: hypothetical protein FKN15_003144 [Acipenser sinensis]
MTCKGASQCSGAAVAQCGQLVLILQLTVWDLKKNLISTILPGALQGLSELRRLDLKKNLISTILPGALQGLSELRRLDLSKNRIGCLSPDVFQGLPNLTKLDLSKNRIGCLSPDVFQGLPNLTKLELILSSVRVAANGKWECVVSTERGNVSRSVEIVVLDSSTSYCVAERVTNNRGDFRWPRTLAGITAFQPCLQYPFGSTSTNGGASEKRALRHCNREGRWEEGDYGQCLYTSDITRGLYTFVLMPINASNALTLALQLRVYTAEAAGFTDTVDVLYVAQMMEKFIGYAEQIRELSEVILDMVSNMLQVDELVLWRAQKEERACSSIVQSLERIAGLRLHRNAQDLSMSSRNIALEAYLIKPSRYTGLSCTAFQRRDGTGRAHEQHLRFRCTIGANNASLHDFPVKNGVGLASVSLPPTLFHPNTPQDCKLQFLTFRNGRLFPSTGNSSGLADQGRRRSVNTPVIYIGMDGCSMWTLSDPVTVSLRHSSPGSDPVAAHWSFKAVDGQGGWIQEGCQLTHSDPNISTLRCTDFSNYAVLQACRSSLLSSDSVEGGAVHARPALEDQHSLRARFMAVVCTHVLFIALWSLGALAVWRGGGEEALLFSCLYGITAVALGLFLLVHHCIRRRDVQAHWLACCCCPSRQARLMQAYLGPAPLESTPTNSSPSLSNPGPCKLTNLLQVTQSTAGAPGGNSSGNGNVSSVCCSLADNHSKYSNNNLQQQHPLLPIIGTTAQQQQQQRRSHKPGGRSKQTATLYHHRGWEGKPHHRIKVIKGGALELLPSTHHTQRPAPSSSESGSLPNSHSESRASPLPNSHSESRASPLPNSHSESRASPLCSSHREAPGEASTSPSEGSDGGGSGRQKPFPLVLLSSTRAPTVPCQGAQRRSVSRDNLKTAASPEREAKRSSYPLNMAVLPPAPPSTHNGFQLDLSPMAPSAGVEGMRGGVWKSETTV